MIILFMSQRFVEKRTGIYGRVVSISAPRLKVPNSGCTQILMNFELLVPVPVCNWDVCCVLCTTPNKGPCYKIPVDNLFRVRVIVIYTGSTLVST